MLVTVQRRPAADVFLALGAAHRAVRHDRLGADFRDGRGRVRHVPDDVRRGDQQPPAGRRLRRGGLDAGGADLVRRRATLAVLRPGRAASRAFPAANELPALALLAAPGAGLLWKAPRQTLVAYVPAAAAGGRRLFRHELDRPSDASGPPTCTAARGRQLVRLTPTSPTAANGELLERQPRGRRPRRALAGASTPCTCWSGHHGIFSLTPVWILSVVGLCMWLWRPDDRRLRSWPCWSRPCQRRAWRSTSAFQPRRPQLRRHVERLPLGLLARPALAPGDDPGGRRHRPASLDAGPCRGCLALSVLSVSYPTWNPWTQPWLYDAMTWLGWISG